MAPGLTSNGSAPSHPNKNTPKHEELQYLELVQEILDRGEFRPDR
jgi:hypothetical protein